MPTSSSTRLLVIVIALIAAAGAVAVWLLNSSNANYSGNSNNSAVHQGPNIILISIDTLRADAVSGFGAPPEQTPYLLKFGDEAVRFDTAISGSHITAPSHATMFTGYSAFVHGTIFQRPAAWKIPKQIKTIAEIMRDAGYYTAAFADGGQVNAEVGFDRGFDVFNSEPNGIPPKLPAIEKYIKGCTDRPVFLFVHTYRPHQPYRPVPRHYELLKRDYSGVYKDGLQQIAKLTHSEAMTPSKRQASALKAMDAKRAKTEDDKQFLRKMYDSGVSGADDEMGALFAMLKKTNIYDSSIIIITSDHGESFFENGLHGHHDVFDPCVRVPLMFRFPGAKHAGMRVQETFPAINLVPTILDLIKLQHKYTFEGVSIGSEFPPKIPDETIAYSSWFVGESGRFPRGVSARRRDGKRIEIRVDPLPDWVTRFGKYQFFSLANDPYEQANITAGNDPLDLQLTKEIEAAWTRWRKMRDDFSVDKETAGEISNKTLDGMRGLGYIK
ncbi:MAG: sulfatase [Planctomycetota bacterium]